MFISFPSLWRYSICHFNLSWESEYWVGKLFSIVFLIRVIVAIRYRLHDRCSLPRRHPLPPGLLGLVGLPRQVQAVLDAVAHGDVEPGEGVVVPAKAKMFVHCFVW